MNSSTNTFHSWDQSEDTSLQAQYIGGEAIVQIADFHQRTVAEIKARIIQLCIMPNFYASTSSVRTRGSSKNKNNVKIPSKPIKSNEQLEVALPTVGKQDIPSNAGKKWDAEQERVLMDNFVAGMSIPALAQLYGRTAGSIASRLFRLGLIDDPFAYNDTKKAEPDTSQITAIPLQTMEFEFPF